MTTRTVHTIDKWTYTLVTCEYGRALHDDMTVALDSVRAWRRMTGGRDLVRCPSQATAGEAIKAYFRHLNECSTCRREWEVRG